MEIRKQFDVDSVAARQIWEAFQRQHDLSNRKGQTAGVEPVSARVWIGSSIGRVVEQRDAEGCEAPLYFFRIGSPTYYIKRHTSLRAQIVVE